MKGRITRTRSPEAEHFAKKAPKTKRKTSRGTRSVKRSVKRSRTTDKRMH